MNRSAGRASAGSAQRCIADSVPQELEPPLDCRPSDQLCCRTLLSSDSSCCGGGADPAAPQLSAAIRRPGAATGVGVFKEAISPPSSAETCNMHLAKQAARTAWQKQSGTSTAASMPPLPAAAADTHATGLWAVPRTSIILRRLSRTPEHTVRQAGGLSRDFGFAPPALSTPFAALARPLKTPGAGHSAGLLRRAAAVPAAPPGRGRGGPRTAAAVAGRHGLLQVRVCEAVRGGGPAAARLLDRRAAGRQGLHQVRCDMACLFGRRCCFPGLNCCAAAAVLPHTDIPGPLAAQVLRAARV